MSSLQSSRSDVNILHRPMLCTGLRSGMHLLVFSSLLAVVLPCK